jgi:hypothetical protein
MRMPTGIASTVFPKPFPRRQKPTRRRAKAKELVRGEGTASVTVLGDPAIEAGLPLLDGVTYVIKTARSKIHENIGLRRTL